MGFTKEKRDSQKRNGYFLICLCSFVFLCLHFLRIFDNNFWGDETYTIRMARMSLSAMVKETAADVHPPLYYAIVKLFGSIFGHSGVVYHLASFVPYVFVVVTALTVVKKWFGSEAAGILVLCASFLETAITYNVEVRMYSWGALFLLSAFLALYGILQNNRKRDYVYFMLFALAGAYTHYYCLISVAFFYLVLIGWAIVKKGTYFKRTLVTCIVTVAVYFPWFIVLLQTFGRTVGGGFWQSYIPYLKDCVLYLFEGRISGVLLAAMLCFTAVGIGYAYVRKDAVRIVWSIAGLSSIFGTILVGNIVSKVFQPVLILRYLYPVSIIAWLLLAVSAAFCRKKGIYTILLSAAMLVTGIPQFMEIYQAEREQDICLQQTLEATKEAVGAGNVILTDLQYLEWTVAEYYYPETECVLIALEDLPKLEQDKQYWLMVRYDISEEISDALQKQGYFVDKAVEAGSLGTNSVIVYRLCANP